MSEDYVMAFAGNLTFFFFSSRRRHTRWPRDWSSDVCSSDLDHGLDALQCPVVVVRGRDAAAASAHHHGAALEQLPDRTQLENPTRFRAGDDPSEPITVGGDGPAALGDQPLGRRAVVDWADRLGGVTERRVVAIHLDHRE